jgi:hypothetical protein
VAYRAAVTALEWSTRVLCRPFGYPASPR